VSDGEDSSVETPNNDSLTKPVQRKLVGLGKIDHGRGVGDSNAPQ